MLSLKRIEFSESSLCQWAGMGDYLLVSPNGEHVMELLYQGEPPHGDSYHKAIIDGRAYPGYVWGRMFTFSPCSRYLAFSAMRSEIERLTAVVDLCGHVSLVLPIYIYQPKIDWPSIVDVDDSSRSYTLRGDEQWLAY